MKTEKLLIVIMKFKFCWDTDCPDWLLAEIANLSTLSSVKLRLLVAHVVSTLLGQPLDQSKVCFLHVLLYKIYVS